jgi:hypothetical protein
VAPGACYDPDDIGCGPRWVGCNVRRLPLGDLSDPLPDSPKWQALTGSERGHGYPRPEAAASGEVALVCEGEPDALTAWQEFGWVGNVVTFGGASQARLPDDARAFLAACPDLVLLFDQDDAGDGAARAWATFHGRRCRRARLPHPFNDLNEYHAKGWSLAGWLRGEWERFGWKVGF